jgi:hypothetical protein
MADAVTRSHLGDGRVVGWYGPAGTVIDAEIRDGAPPTRLVARFGAVDFLARWTSAECAAKLADVPMHEWLQRHGLTTGGVEAQTVTMGDLVISVGRPNPTNVGSGRLNSRTRRHKPTFVESP